MKPNITRQPKRRHSDTESDHTRRAGGNENQNAPNRKRALDGGSVALAASIRWNGDREGTQNGALFRGGEGGTKPQEGPKSPLRVLLASQHGHAVVIIAFFSHLPTFFTSSSSSFGTKRR